MKVIGGVFVLVVLPLALAEFYQVSGWLAERLLRWASHGLPQAHRDGLLDDWVGELDALPGNLMKLGFAVRVTLRVPAIGRELLEPDPIMKVVRRRLWELPYLLVALPFMLLSGLIMLFRRVKFVPRPPERYQRRPFVVLDMSLRRRVLLKLDTPIEHVGLPPHTARTLERGGVTTWGVLLHRHDHGGLFDIRNFGRRDMDAVLQLLERSETELGGPARR